MLEFIQKEPNRIWFAKDFQRDPYFVGYESIARLCDLVNGGFIEKVGTFDKDGNPGGKFGGYRFLKSVVIDPSKRQRKPRSKTKEQLIREAYIAGRNSTWNPSIGMFASAEDLAKEYLETVTL